MAIEPIEFQIVQDLQADLQFMSVGAGYHYTVAAAAVKLDPNQNVEALIAPDGPRPFVLIEVNPEAWEYYPASQVKLTLPVLVHWISDSTPTDDKSRMQTYFRGCADVERAVASDITRGGKACDTRLVKRTFDTAVDGSQVWATLEFEITVYRQYGAPDA